MWARSDDRFEKSVLQVYNRMWCQRPDFQPIVNRLLPKMRLLPGLCPRTPLGGLQRPQSPSWTKCWVTSRSCPARRPYFHIQLHLATPLTLYESSTSSYFSFFITNSFIESHIRNYAKQNQAVNINATGVLQIEHAPTLVWRWRTIITIMYHNNKMTYIFMLCCTATWQQCVVSLNAAYGTIRAIIAMSWASASSCTCTRDPSCNRNAFQCSSWCICSKSTHSWISQLEGRHPAGFIFDPTPWIGLDNTWLTIISWPHIYPAWYVVLLAGSTKADFVGGRYSKGWDDWANICWCVWLTSIRVRNTEYN